MADTATTNRVLRAMSGRCHECRGGTRQSITGARIRCELCGGTGHRNCYGLAQIAHAAGHGVTDTIDALVELEAKKAVYRINVDGYEMWRKNNAAQ